MTRFLYPGHGEAVKLACHTAAFGLFAAMGLWNAAAYLVRREPHLALNAGLYLGGGAWEYPRVREHAKQLAQRAAQ